MADPDDYYEILQVSPNAEDEVIQAAFRRLAFKWHPDRTPNDSSAHEKIRLLNTAYEVLSNSQKRKEYDLRRQQAATLPIPREALRTPPEQRKKPRRAPRVQPPRKFMAYLRDSSRVQGMAAFLLCLSLVDLLVTYLLLRISPHFYESNPVAQWFFQRWNILGMTLFKFAVVGFVIALGEVIERNRPGWGRFVLLGGCGVTAFAIVRGLRLFLGMDN